MSFVLITSAFAAISHEIERLIDPAHLTAPFAATEQQDRDGLIEAARPARPGSAIGWIAQPLEPRRAARTVATLSGRETAQVSASEALRTAVNIQPKE